MGTSVKSSGFVSIAAGERSTQAFMSIPHNQNAPVQMNVPQENQGRAIDGHLLSEDNHGDAPSEGESYVR
jgi:hypothetical protein